jgi:hypothetical protein
VRERGDHLERQESNDGVHIFHIRLKSA